MKEQGTIFRQSLSDFPCSVELGKRMPSWGIKRFNSNYGLRFIPFDDEGFTLRGNKQQLLYKGRRRSHRFTILGDTSFEYDCILEKPPDSNVISLLIEGVDNYDFFRQPEFVKGPFLKGSYAVYKKETLLGEGTGKLCHIHRPQIIDARGRRCWGDLAVVGNVLRITIPEQWLGEALYPVIVDPVVGTSTIGAHYGYWEELAEGYYDEDQEEWIEAEEYYYPIVFDASLMTNRYLMQEDMLGKATAYVYLMCYTIQGSGDVYNSNNTICPCLYSDNKNVPQKRLSTNELYFDHEVNTTNKPDGWRSATFSTSQIINAGTYVWFGVNFEEFHPRFDYGAKCYVCWNDDYTSSTMKIPPPDIYPVENEWWGHDFTSLDIIISVYFNYTAMKHYVRTITQGVKLTDKRKLKADYKRGVKLTVKVNSVISRLGTFFRKCVFTVYNTMNIIRYPAFMRTIADYIKLTTTNSEDRSLSRKCNDHVDVHSEQKRILHISRIIQYILNGIDRQTFSVLFVRSVSNTTLPSDKMRHMGSFIRCLLATAGSVAETTHKAQYHRFQKDKVQAHGAVFRGLLLFVRIITKVFVRDYLLRRFLIARQELSLKSVISREITIESKLG